MNTERIRLLNSIVEGSWSRFWSNIIFLSVSFVKQFNDQQKFDCQSQSFKQLQDA